MGLWLAFGLPAMLSHASSHHPSVHLPNTIAIETIASTLQSSSHSPTDVEQIVEDGRLHYARQDFRGAIALWSQALQHYQHQTDSPHQAMVLTYLSLAHQHLGQWTLAEETIRQSLDFLGHSTIESDAIGLDNRLIGRDPRVNLDGTDAPFLLAQALNAEGRLRLALGQAEYAAESWQQAAAWYDEVGDESGAKGSRINQVEAIATLGQYYQACNLLIRTLAGEGNCDGSTGAEFESVLETITHVPDPSIQALGLRTLGNLLRVVGDGARSRQVLQQGLAISETMMATHDASLSKGSAAIRQSLLLGLGETERSEFDRLVDGLDRTFQPRRRSGEVVERLRTQGAIALEYYQQAAQGTHARFRNDGLDSTSDPIPLHLTQRQAQAQQLRLLLDLRDWLYAHDQDATPEEDAIQTLLFAIISSDNTSNRASASLPVSRLSIYAQLNVAQSLMRVNQRPHQAQQMAEAALQDARAIRDERAESHALGVLGGILERQRDWQQAQSYTDAALALSLDHSAVHLSHLQTQDLAYQWHWQLGRIQAAQGNWEEAIAHYTAAFESLQTLRHDVVFLNPDVQFSFRDTIEPVYRQLVGLLLQPESAIAVASHSVANSHKASRSFHGALPHDSAQVRAALAPDNGLLQQARTVIDALQVAEVENFLRQACTDEELAVIDQVVDQADRHAALLYTIVLEDRLDVILKLPQRDRLQFHSIPVSHETVETTVAQLYALLQQKLPSRAQQAQQQSQQLYDWLVRPFADTLTRQDIQTLVFILDGPLQTIPMATLFDGDRYLIESYAIATTPGLQLVNPAPLNRQSLDALVAGWITPPPNSSLRGLPGVADEIASIEQTLDRTDILTDQSFTPMALEQQINRRAAPIVHLATHGQFSSQPDQTFIATGDGDRLTLDQLGDLLSSRDETRPDPIQLLFLSACQTLAGDKRAALGMAGVAVRSGARSTIASLWQADDEATAQLVANFYEVLAMDSSDRGELGREGVKAFSARSDRPSKAEALRQAQLMLLQNPRFNLPVYWSPFVLLGDWL